MNSNFGIDSNILVYAADRKSPFYSRAQKLIRNVASGKLVGVITPQNLTEYFATVTSSKRMDRPIDAKTAVGEITKLLEMNMRLVFPNNKTVPVFLKLL